MSAKSRYLLLAGGVVIFGVLAWFFAPGLVDKLKPPEQRILGQWVAEDRSAVIEFREGGVGLAKVFVEVNSPMKLTISGQTPLLNATLAGVMSIEGSWEMGQGNTVTLFVPFRLGDEFVKLVICNGKLSPAALQVAGGAFKMRPVSLKKDLSRAAVDFVTSRPSGYHFPDMSMSGIMIGENLYVATGSVGGGGTEIASGFTLQTLPSILKPAAAGVDIVLSTKEGLGVKALVITQGGLRLATTYRGMRIAYELQSGNRGAATYSLDSVTGITEQAKCAGCLSFTPRYVSFAETQAR